MKLKQYDDPKFLRPDLMGDLKVASEEEPKCWRSWKFDAFRCDFFLKIIMRKADKTCSTITLSMSTIKKLTISLTINFSKKKFGQCENVKSRHCIKKLKNKKYYFRSRLRSRLRSMVESKR